MASNYGIPTNKKIRGRNGMYLGEGWDNITGGTSGTFGLDYSPYMGMPEFSSNSDQNVRQYWTGSENDGSLHSNSCNSWTSKSSSAYGRLAGPNSYAENYPRYVLNSGNSACNNTQRLLCVCY